MLTIIAIEIINMLPDVQMIISCLDGYLELFETRMGQYGVKPLDQGSFLMSRPLELKSKQTIGAFSPSGISDTSQHQSHENVLTMTCFSPK